MNKLAGFLVGATLVTASIPTGVMALDMGVMDYAVGNQIVLSEFRVSDGEKGGRATIKLNDPIMKEGQVGGEIFGFRIWLAYWIASLSVGNFS